MKYVVCLNYRDVNLDTLIKVLSSSIVDCSS
jgi:hypothetical protein